MLGLAIQVWQTALHGAGGNPNLGQTGRRNDRPGHDFLLGQGKWLERITHRFYQSRELLPNIDELLLIFQRAARRAR